jgi:hypothetical protein
MSQKGISASAPRIVTAQEIDHFQSMGWAILRQLVSPECAQEMLVLAQAAMAEPSPVGYAAATIGNFSDYGSWLVYHFVALKDQLEPYKSVVFSETMKTNVQLLSGRACNVRYYVDEVACKMPAQHVTGSRATKWHQDFPDFAFDRTGFVGFWLALDEIPPERGTLRFLSGAHREGPLGRDFGIDQPDLLDRYPFIADRYPQSLPIHLNPGDATCHGSLTVHGAPQNTTPEPRWAYILSYFPDDVLYTGAANPHSDRLGLQPNKSFDHPRFPLVAP